MNTPEKGSAASGAGRSPEIQAVSRAGQVLELFGPQSTALASTEIADRLGLNRTTGYR